jgi:hypothetical protein
MSKHIAFRRAAMDQQYAQALRVINIPAPTRGIIEDENEAFMKPGGALVQDNWLPTMRGVKLRGGTKRWADLHAGDVPVPPLGGATRTEAGPGESPWMIDYSKTAPYTIDAMQVMADQIDALTAALTLALERITMLERKVNQ